MARSISIAKRLRKFAKKAVFSKTGLRVSAISGGALVGAVGGATRSEPGLRKQGSKEGAIGGALVGGALAYSPSIARLAGRTVKNEGKRAAKILKKKGRVVFRRIRGRIIPIKVSRGAQG